MSATMLKASMRDLPDLIRVSVGSAMVLGLSKGKLDAAPTTAYLMTYRKNRCAANCGFCPQARSSKGRADMLSRVSWPVFPTSCVFNRLKEAVKEGGTRRVCIQALNYPNVFVHLRALLKAVHAETNVPISVSCQPPSRESIQSLATAGAERIGIPLDAATEELFDKVKGLHAGGPYTWKRQFELLKDAINVFGEGKVSTHLIVGLGETEKEMVQAIQQCVDIGVLPALFAFTPIRGTPLEDLSPPAVETYRRIQLSRYMILHGLSKFDAMGFNDQGRLTCWGNKKNVLSRIVQTGTPFLTSGCLDCNRPYYNERPSGPLYNYPNPLTHKELCETEKELGLDEAQAFE